MTTINETLRVECPYVRARQYLHEMLSEAPIGRESHLLLRAPVPIAGAELKKGVRVHYARTTDSTHLDEPWYIGWDPEPGGIYPSFSGELTVRADEGYATAILELNGSYAAPLGAAGALFDMALGRKVAGETIRALLNDIAKNIVERYRREESGKHAV